MYFISNIHEQFKMLSSVAITTSTANRCYSAIRNVHTTKKTNHLKREYCTNFTAFCCLGAAPNFTSEKLKLRDCLWYEIVRNLAQTFIIQTALRLKKTNPKLKKFICIFGGVRKSFHGTLYETVAKCICVEIYVVQCVFYIPFIFAFC